MSTPIFKAGSWGVKPQVVVSGGGLTLSTAAGSWLSNTAEVFGQGPLYFEVTIGGSAAVRSQYENTALGFDSTTPSRTPSQIEIGIDLCGNVFKNDSPVGSVIPANATYIGDVVMLAKDEKGNFWAGKNGAWFSGGDPSTRANPLQTLVGGAINVRPCVALYNATNNSNLTFTANFSSPIYPVPTGFTLFSDHQTSTPIDLAPESVNYSLFSPQPATIKTSPAALLGARHFYFSGRGRVSGTVKTTNTPANTPVRRRVQLIRERESIVIAEQWSDPITGAYSFDYIDASYTYTVLSYDHTGIFRAVVADNLIPTIIPAVAP